ncbi:class I SAM-dependent methyltransferase [Alicyclobacillus sp. ALC3]|uniref:class I SAM-dependent methyltransferase n=1 Tax=Alicyclobacillus sp. ALC3 TaxID=2796143 RepID=UPI002378E927|nr:class I SAM-dependent methyltransferase [Alicyclobacillus sp. ALC3]WDL98365.1 class I SAM-dependent methyltransferase [Alicyclobacillus sp. ALC3]
MVNHPRFSQAYIWGQDLLEKVVGDVRTEQNRRAYGATLIVGAGTGLDVGQLAQNVSETVMLEPDDTMRGYLNDKFPHLRTISSPAERMDIADEEFDTVVTSLVLCSVDRVDQVLREIHRVLKPTGQYLFLEHVKHDAPVPSLLQNVVNPLWKRVGGGCHLNRDIHLNLVQSPFKVVEYSLVKPNFLLPIVAGRALK